MKSQVKFLVALLQKKIAYAHSASSAFWQARNQREQSLLATAAAAVIAGLIYMSLIAPALSGQAALEKSLPQMRQQAARMQQMAKEASSLSAIEKSAVPMTLNKKTVEMTLAKKGLQPKSIAVTADSARLQLTAVSFSDVLAWLKEMQMDGRLNVVSASFVAAGQVDTVDVGLTLQRTVTGE